MNCHMPHTTFGLFVAMRSHRVDSPDLALAVESGRPNACNQCHLDQSLQWTADWLSEWYGHERVQPTVPAQPSAAQGGAREQHGQQQAVHETERGEVHAR